MQRVPEPELMDEPDQARAYAEADFSEPNALFLDQFRSEFPGEALQGYVLDLGCGPGEIPLRFARAYPNCRVHGVDGAESMLAFARAAAARAGLDDRIRFVRARLPLPELPRNRYDAIISNSLLHHLEDPRTLWEAVVAFGATGAPLLVMDLLRPESTAQLDTLMARYVAEAPGILKRDFQYSLRAAYRVEEVRGQLESTGLDHLAVRVVSDRHFVVAGRLIG